MYFVPCSTTCLPEVTFNHKQARAGVCQVWHSSNANAKPLVSAGRSALALLSEQRVSHNGDGTVGGRGTLHSIDRGP